MVFQLDQNQENKDNYDDLLVSIEANYGQLNLLIAVCDNPEFWEQIIQKYEQELAPKISTYRIKLSPEKPSLSFSINELIQDNPELKDTKNAVITVTGTEQFRFLPKLESKKQSPQEELLGYFQWTREAFKKIPCSVTLWMTSYLQQQLEQKSPDFWSWRKGVFRFTYPATSLVDLTELKPQLFTFTSEINQESSSLLPLEDLQELIAKIEQSPGKEKGQLAILYSDLGRVYKERSERGKSFNYQEEQNLGIEYLQKAINLQERLSLELELASSLSDLAELYRLQGRYKEAEPLFLRSLKLRKKLLGEDHSDVATSLNNLAIIYDLQGRYEEAQPLFIRSLDLRRKLLGEDHPDVAGVLNNLALLYRSKCKYKEAETLFIQALDLSRKLLGEDHPDVAGVLNNIALLCASQGRDEEAEKLNLQALELRKKFLGTEHPYVSSSLNNLALLYSSQGRYEEAEPLYLQALELRRKLLGEDHPNTITVNNNFNNFLKRVVQENRASELSNHPITRSRLEKLQLLS